MKKNNTCCWYENPVCMTFKIIALVLLGYGVWKQNWSLVLIAVAIALLGCLIKYKMVCNRKKVKKR